MPAVKAGGHAGGSTGLTAGRVPVRGELPDDPCEPGWLVEGDERVTVGYLGQLSLREEFGEAPTVLGWHHAVLAGPDHQGRVVVIRQAFGRLNQELGVGRRCPQGPDGVAADRGLGHDRLHPPGGGGVSAYGQPPERDRAPPDRPVPPSLIRDTPANAIGTRRTARSRICCMNSPNIAGGSLPASTSVLPVSPGGKLSKASQETSTTRPTRAAPLPPPAAPSLSPMSS